MEFTPEQAAKIRGLINNGMDADIAVMVGAPGVVVRVNDELELAQVVEEALQRAEEIVRKTMERDNR